jgi:lipid-binding SYLF domain-containing protein
MTGSATLRLFALLALIFSLGACASATQGEKQALVEKAQASAERFSVDPDMSWFRDNLGHAEGVLIIPTVAKAGLIIGASGGSGVMLMRDDDENWSYPAFYTMGSLTLGLQIGGEISEIALVIMTKAARDSLLSNDFRLGGDISVATGPIGAGAKAQIVDVLAFSRTKGGLYGGLNLEGAMFWTREDWNRAYYDEDVRAVDILVSGKGDNPGADPLRQVIASAATTTATTAE